MSRYYKAISHLAAPRIESEPPADVVTLEEARQIGEQIGIDWANAGFPLEEFAAGLVVEREHGPKGPGGDATDVTRGNPLSEGKIAWSHLLESPDYYTRLRGVEGGREDGASTDPDDYR